jgi:transcriptional regulator with XRE-family HTH domain
MEWGASRILALRKHASMTQAQFAQWLGVTIKQVKYLEHQRRNPSGPTRRLMDILALELRFDGAAAVQVLGASPTQLKKPAAVPKPKIVPTKRDDNGSDAGLAAATPSAEAPVAAVESLPPAPSGDAFVWL